MQRLTQTVEHNISTEDDKSRQPSRRPDLSTFFSQLELVDTSDPHAHTNANALPQPENMTAAFRLLANAFETMRGRPADESNEHGDLLANMIEVLRANADDPPTELKGVPNSFLDELERVPKKALKPSDTCPICVNPFLEGRSRASVKRTRSSANWYMHRQISPRCPAAVPRGSSLRSGLHRSLA